MNCRRDKSCVTWFVTVIFSLSSAIQVTPLFAQPVSASFPRAIPVSEIQIPSEFASLEERFESPDGPKAKTIIAIQNPHGIFDAQKNIRSVIQALQDQYGFELAGLEGGDGKLDHTLLRTFPDKEINHAQAMKYMRMGELSGAEAAAILNPHPGVFYGIEDRELYFKNLNSFLKGLEEKAANLHALGLIAQKLDKISRKIYPPELLGLHQKEQQYQKGLMPLWEWLGVLSDYVDQQGILLQEKYPNVLLIFQAMAEARKKPGKEALKKKEEELTSKIEGRVLFEELDALSRQVKSRYFTAPEISTLDHLYQQLKILKDLAGLEILREDFNFYSGIKQKFEPQVFQEFLKKYGESADLKWNLEPAETFYRDAIQRDNALYDKLIQAMKNEKKDRAVLISGGFHSNGLRERMRKDGVSYIIYVPRIESFEEENPYLRVIRGDVSYTRGSRFSIESILPTGGLLSEERANEFLETYLEGGLEALAKKMTREELERFGKVWVAQIQEEVGGREVASGSIIEFAQKLVREMIAKKTGVDRIRPLLDNLKLAFTNTMGELTKERVQEFVDRVSEFLEGLQERGLELKPLYFDILIATRFDVEKALEYAALPEKAGITYDNIARASPQVPVAVSPAGRVITRPGIAPQEWVGNEKEILLEEAAAKGFLDIYAQLVREKAPEAASARAMGLGEEFWKYKKISPERLARLKELHAEYVRTSEERDRHFGKITEELNRTWAEITKQGRDPYSFKGVQIMKYWDGKVSIRLGYDLDARELSPLERASLTVGELEKEEIFLGVKDATGEDFWREYYELDERINQIAKAVRSAEGHLVEITSRPYVGDPDYLKRAEQAFLEEPLPYDHIFKMVMKTYYSDYNATGEKVILDLLRAYGRDILPNIKSIRDDRKRKFFILGELEPLILNSDGMPEEVKRHFRWIVATYIYDAGYKLIPTVEGQSVVDLPAYRFLDQMRFQLGLIVNPSRFNKDGDQRTPDEKSAKTIGELIENFGLNQPLAPLMLKNPADVASLRDGFVLEEILLRDDPKKGEVNAILTFRFLRNKMNPSMDISTMTGEGIVRMLVEIGTLKKHPQSQVFEARPPAARAMGDGRDPTKDLFPVARISSVQELVKRGIIKQFSVSLLPGKDLRQREIVHPISIQTLSDGSFVVGDSSNVHGAAIYKPDGVVLFFKDERGEPLGYRNTVKRVAVDENDTVFVVTTDGLIRRYSANGDLLGTYQIKIKGKEAVGINVQGMVVLQNKLYYTIMDIGSFRVLDLITGEEKSLIEEESESRSMDLTVDPLRGRILIFDKGSSLSKQQVGDLGFLSFPMRIRTYEVETGQVDEPMEIPGGLYAENVAVDTDGNIYLTFSDRASVLVMNPLTGVRGFLPVPSGRPARSIYVDRDGNIWLGREGGVDFIPKGSVSEIFAPFEAGVPEERAVPNPPSIENIREAGTAARATEIIPRSGLAELKEEVLQDPNELRAVLDVIRKAHPALGEVNTLIGKTVTGTYTFRMFVENRPEVKRERVPFEGRLKAVRVDRGAPRSGALMRYRLKLTFENMKGIAPGRMLETFTEEIMVEPQLDGTVKSYANYDFTSMTASAGPAAGSLGRAELDILSKLIVFNQLEDEDREKISSALVEQLDRRKTLNDKKAYMAELGKEIEAHMLEALPQYFDEGAFRLVAASVSRLSVQDLRDQVYRSVSQLLNQPGFNNLAGKEEIISDLTDQFTPILQGVSLAVIEKKREEEKAVVEDGVARVKENTRTSEDQGDMQKAIGNLMTTQTEWAKRLLNEEERYILGLHAETVPTATEAVAGIFEPAFAASPVHVLTGEPSLSFQVPYTRNQETRIKGIEAFREELKKAGRGNIAQKIDLSLKRSEDLYYRALEKLQTARKENEYVMFVVPHKDILAGMRGANMLLYRFGDLPDELSFVDHFVAGESILLAKALSLPEDDDQRKEYMKRLRALGIEYKYDAQSSQMTLSVNLRMFLDNLFTVQKAVRAARVAA